MALQFSQTSRGLRECNLGKPCTLSQEFLSLEGGRAHLLPPKNFIFDENVHPDPDEHRQSRELAACSNTADEASSVLERQALLPNCHYKTL